MIGSVTVGAVMGLVALLVEHPLVRLRAEGVPRRDAPAATGLAREVVHSVSGYADAKTYSMGTIDAAGTDATVAAMNDRYRRHVFVQTVRFVNPSGRRTS